MNSKIISIRKFARLEPILYRLECNTVTFKLGLDQNLILEEFVSQKPMTFDVR